MSSQKKVNLGSFKEIEIAPNYKINPQGLIYSTRSKRLLKSYISNEGYVKITLWINKKRKYLGSASTAEEAGELYQKAYNEIMNEFYPE